MLLFSGRFAVRTAGAESRLFDRGFISFENDGRLLVSPVADRASLRRMGGQVESELNVGRFASRQGWFLEFQRDAVYLRSAVAL